MTKTLMIETNPEGCKLGDPPETLEKIDAPHAAEAATPDIPPAATVPQPKITQAEAWANVETAHKALGEARVQVKLLQQQQLDTRRALAVAIEAWAVNADPGSPEERRAREHRNYLASEQARKQALADAGIQGPRMSTKNHAAFDPISGRTGHKGNSRGAFPKQFLGRSVNDPSMFRGAPAKKI